MCDIVGRIFMTDERCCDLDEHEGLDDIKKKMLDDDMFFYLADFFKMFGDSTRIKIICALFNGDMCVGSIAELLNMTQSSISHQLRILKASRLVKVRKEGKYAFYSLDDIHVVEIYKMGLEHIKEKL
jgi:ArsR family transcriptional regulator